jgi:predicted enzyme related to lactoylglutathione lyase
MPQFIHIDIAADDPERAAGFFQTVFGWRVRRLDGPVPYWLIDTGPADGAAAGIGAGVARRDESWQSATPTIEVPSVDDYARRIEAAGGSIVRPKAAIPGVGQLVTFKDTEGNVFAILEPERNAPPGG